MAVATRKRKVQQTKTQRSAPKMRTKNPDGPAKIRTLADLMQRLGDVPLDRVRFLPAPGTATVADVTRILDKDNVICELIEGVLLEKTVGMIESRLAMYLAGLLNAFVIPRNLGVVTGPDGTMQIIGDLVRIPDVAFISWDRLPGRKLPKEPVPLVAPNLAAEVLSKSNTPKEMSIKRKEYFKAGVGVVWEIDPKKRTIDVYTAPTNPVTLGIDDTLDGGTVLPGFKLLLKDLFAELDRQG
jgi:Uma2 family endonuclease